MQKKKSSFRYLTAAFLLPASVMLAVYAWYGIYPFGNRSILVADMNNQYISYFSYLKEALCGGHGFFYSFSKTLCGGMAGLTAYYLMGPWNLLMLFFPVFSLPTAVELITIWDSGNVLPCGIGNPHKFELKNEIWHSLSGGEVGGSVCGRGNGKGKAQSEDPVFAWFGTNGMRPMEVRVNGEPAGQGIPAVYNSV